MFGGLFDFGLHFYSLLIQITLFIHILLKKKLNFKSFTTFCDFSGSKTIWSIFNLLQSHDVLF